MRWTVRTFLIGVSTVGLLGGLAGCIVVPPRAVVVAPAPPVEVIPVAPGPEFVWVGGWYDPYGHWHRGYYRRR